MGLYLAIALILIIGIIVLKTGRGPFLVLILLLEHCSAACLWIRREMIGAVCAVRSRYWECLREVRAR